MSIAVTRHPIAPARHARLSLLRGRFVALATQFLRGVHVASGAIAVTLLLVAAASPAAATMLGANKFDLMLDYVAPNPPPEANPDGYRLVRKAMGKKAILDARSAGLTFLRAAVAGYGAADLALWQSNPPQFWALLDRMFDDLDATGMRLVPSFVWNIEQFPLLGRDTIAIFMREPQSASRKLLVQFLRDFIDRYKGRRTILFYEMGNELNLLADLDGRKRNCKRDPCVWDNFTTEDMNKFAYHVAGSIKQLDPSRAVGSGYSLPRPNAMHLEQHPEFGASGPDWTPDTAEEFARDLTATQAPFDVVSIHVYPDDEARPSGRTPGKRFDPIAVAAQAVHAAGKKLFIGEFGDDKGATPFMRRTFEDIVHSRVDFASIWVWEFYQNSTDDRVKTGMNAEPGFTDDLIALLVETERHLGAAPPQSAPAAPQVVLTWPMPCAEINAPIDLAAVASDGARAVKEVEFLVDGALMAKSVAPPYRARFNPAGSAPHSAEIVARAVAASGAVSSYRATVHLNGDTSRCEIGG